MAPRPPDMHASESDGCVSFDFRSDGAVENDDLVELPPEQVEDEGDAGATILNSGAPAPAPAAPVVPKKRVLGVCSYGQCSKDATLRCGKCKSAKYCGVACLHPPASLERRRTREERAQVSARTGSPTRRRASRRDPSRSASTSGPRPRPGGPRRSTRRKERASVRAIRRVVMGQMDVRGTSPAPAPGLRSPAS